MPVSVVVWMTRRGRSLAAKGKGMRTSQEGDRYVITYDSMSDLVSSLEGKPECYTRDSEIRSERRWHGGVRSTDEAIGLARKGMVDRVPDAMKIAESAVETAEAEYDMPAFQTFYDVSGSDVDVARYLSGEPENMISYQMVDTPRVGRVITLVSGIAASGGVSADILWERGVQTVALILALEKIGFQVELWTDMTASNGPGRGEAGVVRTLVKGPGDLLDVSQVMFAFAHPGNFRVLHFAAMHLFPAKLQKEIGVGFHYGYPQDPDPEMYHDGAVVIPSAQLWRRGYDSLVPDTLKELGLIK